MTRPIITDDVFQQLQRLERRISVAEAGVNLASAPVVNTGISYDAGDNALSILGGKVALTSQDGARDVDTLSTYPNWTAVGGVGGHLGFPDNYDDDFAFMGNVKWDNAVPGWVRLATGYSAYVSILHGEYTVANAASGAAGGTPSFINRFIIRNTGEIVGAAGFIDASLYSSLAAAVAAASPGQCVLLHPGTTYALGATTLTLPIGVSLYSPSPFRGAYGAGGARITGSISPMIQFAGGDFAGKQSIQGITFQSTASGTNAYIFLYDFVGFGLGWLKYYDCMFDMSGSSATNRGAIWHTWHANGTAEEIYYEHCGFNGCDTAIGGDATAVSTTVTGVNTLNSGTINVGSTTNFPSSGSMFIGLTSISYSGKTGTSFTGCSAHPATVGGELVWFSSDWDKCVIEKCRFDQCRGTAAMPAQIFFKIAFTRTGAIRDCVFEGANNAARAGIYLGTQFQTFTLDDVYMEGMASAAASTYDEVVIADPPGDVSPGTNLLVSGTRLNDRGGSSNAVRYSLNLEDLGGSFMSLGTFTVTIASPGVFTRTNHGLAIGDAVLLSTTGALPTGLSSGGTVYYVISAGFTANTFQVSTTKGGTAVNTSGSQSGTHSLTAFTASAFITACNIGVLRLSRFGGYSADPALSAEIRASNVTVS